jgi:hypothetical protein
MTPDHHEQIQRILGRRVSPQQIAAAANAMGNANVYAMVLNDSMFEISVRGDGYSCRRTFTKHRDGTIELHNDIWEIQDGTPFSGRGINIFLNQVRAARAAGINRITTSAAGSLERAVSGGMNGYITWPKFGYDGEMQEGQVDRLPREMREALGDKRNIQSLFALPGGAQAWEIYGNWIDLEFDLSDDSENMKTLDKYLAKRQAEGERPQRPVRRADPRPVNTRVRERREKLQREMDEAIEKASRERSRAV